MSKGLSELQKRRLLSIELWGQKHTIKEKAGVSIQTVYNYFSGINSNRKVQEAINEILKEKKEKVEVNSNS